MVAALAIAVPAVSAGSFASTPDAVAAPAAHAAAGAATCPPAGARFEKDNFLEKSILTSLGGPPDPLIGCKYRSQTGEIVYFRPESQMTPLGKAGSAAGTTTSATAAVPAGPPPLGVYECDAPTSVSGMIMGAPSTGFMFGLTSRATYRDFDGGRGSYRYAGTTLTMTTGPLKGVRYRRTGTTLFKPLDAKGAQGSIRCILNRAKSLTGRW